MKKDMSLEGLRWSCDSGSALYDTPPNGRSRTGWGGPAMESLGTGAGRGKASSCPFLPIPAPLRPVPSDSIAGPQKKGRKIW